MTDVVICVCHPKSVQYNFNIVLIMNVWSNLHCFIFFAYLIELDGPLFAKSSYCDELSVAKSFTMLSVAKSWTVELSVAKDNVRRCIHITTASLATVGVRRYNF